MLFDQAMGPSFEILNFIIIIMLESTNPFNDPEFKKQILAKEGRIKDDDIDSCDVEEVAVDPESQKSLDFKGIIAAQPPIPKTVKNLIADASALALNEKEQKVQEMNVALNNIFTEYNKTYGTDLVIDFNSLSNTLVNVSDPEKRRTLELYVSEILKSTRPVLLLHLIAKLKLAIEYVTAPERMFDQNQLSLPDLFLVIDKLISYIQNLEEIVKTSAVKDSDKLLEKMAQDKNDPNLKSDESKKAVDEFMKLFNKEHGIGQ